MAHLTWLHLSDWHQHGKDFDRKVVRDKLLEDLEQRETIDPRLAEVDFVIFSGDLAFAGLTEEYEAARENLFEPVLQAVALTPDLLFVVPGNHDLQRSVISEMLPMELQKPLESDELVSKWLTDEKRRQRVLEPFEAFTQFVEGYTKQSQPAYSTVRRLKINGIDVALLGLNSAWMCGRNKDAEGVIKDYGNLIIGEPQIHDSLGEISGATVRIAVLHHPFKWLKEFEQSKIERRLKSACHFILRGHEHEPDADWSRGPQGECLTIPAGASYDRRIAVNTRYNNSYNFVHLDFENASGSVFFRRWSESRTAWIKDVDTCDDGQLPFVLPKQMGSIAAQENSPHAAIPNHVTIQAEYRRQTIETFKDLSFKGLTASVRPILLPVEKVYVQLRAVAEVPESADEFTPEERRVLRWMEEEGDGFDAYSPDLREAQMRLDALRRERWTKDRLERFPIADALKDPKRRGLVILGDPGSGKSTLLHFLALIFARGPHAVSEYLKLTGEEADRLPIFAPLAAYDDMLNHDGSLTLQNFLAKYYAHRRAMPGLANLFDPAIHEGRALVLLDGMDEVLEEGRRKFVADQASSFIRALINRGNRVLLTSRIYGYRAAPISVELPHVTVLDFRREEIETFAQQWNEAMAEWEYADRPPAERQVLARDEERALLEEIKSNPGVERLAANPLLLSMLALLRRQVGRLPQQRIRLYALYLGTLIDAWEASRSPGARVDAPIRPEAGRAELVLIPLALWLQQNKPSGTATEAEIIAQITSVFLREDGFPADLSQETPEWGDTQVRARKFLEDMRRFSGLLVERGHGVFGFRHLTFQEYYVGRALARMEAGKRWELLGANLHANRWREPILLAAAQLGNMQADEEACTMLVKQILEAQSPHEEILHRDLFLAADCAGDDINVHIVTLRRIVAELKPLVQANIPIVAQASISRLVNLLRLFSAGKPRLPEVVQILVAAMPTGYQSVLPIDKFVGLVSPLFQLFPAIRDVVIESLQNEDVITRMRTIQALQGLLFEDRSWREAIERDIDDENVGPIVIQTLAPFVDEDGHLRQIITTKIKDSDSTIRQAAVYATRNLLSTDLRLRVVIAKLLNDEWYGVRVAAIRSLAGFITTDPSLRRAITQRLNDLDEEVQAAAIEASSQLLSDDDALRHTVAAKLNNPSVKIRTAAINTLAGICLQDPSLEAAIREKLNDVDANVRAAAIRVILKTTTFESALIPLLEHQDWRTRRDTILVLAERLQDDKQITDLLVRVMDDLRCEESSAMRAGGIKSIGALINKDGSLLELVIRLLDDEAANVRSSAIRSLAPLVSDNRALLNRLTHMLNDASGQVRVAIIEALSGLLSEDPGLRKVVKQRLKDEVSSVKIAALHALADFINEDLNLRKSVTELLNDKFYLVRLSALHSLAEFVREDETVYEKVAGLLNDTSARLRAEAIHALGGSRAADSRVSEAIEAMLSEEDTYTLRVSISSIAETSADDPILLKQISKFLNSTDPNVRSAAVNGLAKYAIAEPDLRNRILGMLHDESATVRIAAFHGLEPLFKDTTLRHSVSQLLHDKNPSVRSAAINALACFISEDQQLREQVALMLNDESVFVRGAAVEALSVRLSEDQSLRDIITPMKNESSSFVRLAVLEALAQFISDRKLRVELSVVLQMDDDELFRSGIYSSPRTSLVKSWGEWARTNPQGIKDAIDMLASEDWRLRLGGAEILREAGARFVQQGVPQLLAAMESQDGFDSFPARIAAAGAVINYSKFCGKALAILVSALSYGVHPLVIVPGASGIRSSAALALGKLKAEEYQPEVVQKLKETLQTEVEPVVLDGLYSAILSLASAPA